MRRVTIPLILTCVGLLGVACLGFAYPRTVLVEDFTNWGCPPCNPATTLLHETLTSIGTPQNAIDLAYHMYWPNGADPFYLANTTDNLARKTYYGVNAVPTFECDGAAVSPWSTIASAISNRLTVPSPLWMDLFTSVNGSTISVTAKVVSEIAISGNYVLHLVLCDRYDSLASPNGNPNHYHPMRKMSPTASGQTYSATPSDTGVFTATFTMEPGWYINNLDVVGFVQNNSNREVLQSRGEEVPGNFPGLEISMTPINPPLQIPANGGSFNFNVSIHNGGNRAYTFEGWIMQQLPNGSWQGPMLGPVDLTVPSGVTITRTRTQLVPATAPAGAYFYCGYLGFYWGDAKWDSSGFDYAKLGSGDGPIVSSWENVGESFEPWNSVQQGVTPETFGLIQAYPNPFNPSTMLSYTLSQAAVVDLAVFDLRGREVAHLVDGWRDAGEHQVTFDGSRLVSGIYLIRLIGGNQVTSGKMVLLK